MELLKKHSDTVATIISLLTVTVCSMIWINGKFNDVDRKFSDLEKDMAIIKTVLVMQKIMPAEIASNDIDK